jgi:hypothetical protein
MLPAGLQTPREVTLYYDSVYESLIDSGNAVPFLYPWAGIGAFLVIGYLLIDHRQNAFLQQLRYPTAGALLAFQTWCVITNKAKHPAAAFGVGLLSAWGVFWVSTLMAVNDCQTDFVRIERSHDNLTDINSNGVLNGSSDKTALAPGKTAGHSSRLYWQSYPHKFVDRMDWVTDVFCSFRGVGWNLQTSTVPPLPKPASTYVPETIEHAGQTTMTVSRVGIRRFRDKGDLLSSTFRHLVIGYLVLDLVKVLMHRDPYFWGYMDAAPPTYLPIFVQRSHTLVRSYRLLISLTGIYTALWEIFKLGPAFFCGVLGPRLIGVRGEAWMNPPDMFGSFTCVLDNGLAGWWGGWWHQVFRSAFEAHSKWLLRTLKIDGRSRRGKLFSLFVAFFISGCLHASGSYTQLGDTRPLMGPMRFFMLQFVGIVTQIQAISLLRNNAIFAQTPTAVKRIANFVLVHIWLYYTAPLLMDDFAKGGIWLFEPVAFSPLRALGFGAKDDSFFCWWNGILFWRSGKDWWDSGIAV